MHEVLVNRLGGLSLPRKSVVRLTDRPDMTLDVYRGRKTTIQQQQQPIHWHLLVSAEGATSRGAHQGPLVQNTVSLTGSLKGHPLEVFYDFIPKHTDNFCWKKWEQHFFQQKYWRIWNINGWNFNETLTNEVVSFEQPGPDVYPGEICLYVCIIVLLIK